MLLMTDDDALTYFVGAVRLLFLSVIIRPHLTLNQATEFNTTDLQLKWSYTLKKVSH